MSSAVGIAGLPSQLSSRARRRIMAVLPIAVVVLALGIVPFIGVNNRTLNLATTAIILGTAASGLGFMWGQSGQTTIAHASVMGVGAYTAGLVFMRLQVGFGLALILAIVAGGLVSGLISSLSVRVSGHYFVILTFAVAMVITAVERRWEDVTGGVNGMTVLPGDESFLGLRLADRMQFYLLCAIVLTLTLIALQSLTYARWGTTLRGARENRHLAWSLGANVVSNNVRVGVVAGLVAGAAGCMYVFHFRAIEPGQFSVNASIFFILMVLLGGRGYLLGPVLGAIVYTFLPETLFFSPILSQIALGAILIIIILLLPSGLLSLGARIRDHRRAKSAAQASAIGQEGA